MSAYKVTLVKSDRLPTLSVRLYDPGQNNDLSASTVTLSMFPRGSSTPTINAGSCSVQPAITFTAGAVANELTANAHGMENGWEVTVASAGTLPSGLSSAARYFVVEATQNTFKLSLKPSGPPGSGAHSVKVLGQVQYAWGATDTTATGTYRAWFAVTTSTKVATWPNNNTGITVEIVSAP
jgi:hypothetical protein